MRNQRTHILPRLVLAGLALVVMLLLSAPSALASEGCPNEAVRGESNINPTTHEPYDRGLPECRAYEMVTPLDKQGHDTLTLREGGPPIVANSGNGMEWAGQGDYAGAENYQVHGASPTNPYVATRTASGWVTRSAYPPSSAIVEPFQAFGATGLFSPELTTEIVCGGTTVAGAETGPDFRCDLREGEETWALTPTFASLTDATNNGIGITLGGSQTGGVYVFHGEAGVPLLPADTSLPDSISCDGEGGHGEGGCGGIYEVTGIGTADPELRLVNVDNAGNMIGPENGNAVGAFPLREPAGGAYQAISADGSKIFFTATPSGGVPTLYARVNGVETVTISNPSPSECTTCSDTPAEGRYQGAAVNGEKVFFTTEQQLLNGDTDTSNDLYEYDFSNPVGHKLTQVSAGGLGDTTPGSGANVEGVVATSEDGSHVYYIARGVLTSLPNSLAQTAQPNADNLYGYDTETNETKFIGTLFQSDDQLWGFSALSANDKGKYDSHLAQTTPDGRYLLFDTSAQLITSGPEADTSGAQQVYRYDFRTGKIIRVSVGHEGYANSGNVPGFDASIAPAFVGSPTTPTANQTSRSLSEDGQTIVFTTAAQLQSTDTAGGATESCVAEARDDGPGCQVYVWHECVSGHCTAGDAGEVNMISDGQDPVDVIYAGMSATGSDIFFQTRTQLVGQDTDTLGDIYDARIDGGFPAPAPEPSCTGEACQGTQSASPTFGPPGSQTFTGGGNQTAPPFKEVLEPAKPKSKPLTRAQKLTSALKTCKRDRAKKKREACQKAAQKKYSPVKQRVKKKKS